MPTVTGLTVDPPTFGSHAFVTNDTISLGVTFSEAVTITGAPRIAIDIGGTTRQAGYLLGSRTTRLLLTYRVQAADVDHDGIGIGARALTLNGGTVRSASRVDAVLGLGDHALADAWNLRVNSGAPAPRFTAPVPAKKYAVGVAVDDPLPAATDATTYTLTGPGTATTLRLPPGLRFDEAPRAIVGTPTENRAAATYTLTAHDDTTDADAATQTFPIAVTGQPTFAAAAQTFVVTAGKAVRLALPAARGGDGTLGYGVRPGLPRGLTFDAAPRTIAGTPATAQAATTYTYTATDADGDAAHLAVSLRILAADAPTVTGLAFDPPVGGVAFYPGSQIVATVTFSEAVTVGTGGGCPQLAIDLDGTTRRMSYNSALSGPTLLFAYRVQTSDVDLDGLSVPRTALTLNGATIRAGALDANPDLGSRAFADRSTLKVNGRPRPVFGGTQAPLRFRQNVRDAFTLPAATGGEGASTYSLGATPALPDGLTYYAPGAPVSATLLAAGGGDSPLDYTLAPALPGGLSYTAPAVQDAHGGTIAGTPGAGAPAATYRLTATDADGDAARQTFTLEVTADALPRFDRKSGPAQRYVTGSAVTATLPAATGGNGTLGYALTGPGDVATLTLPRGLAFAAGTRQIFGTPAVAAATATYTLQVSDGDTAALTFPLTVEADARPTFDPATWTAQHYRTNTPVSVALSAAAGGNGTLRYALTPTDSATGLPALPAGLTYYAPGAEIDAQTTATGGGALAGTPTATDADGDATTLTFSVQVAEDLTPAFAVSAGPAQQYRHAVMVSATLPAATGGDTTPTPALTYSVDPALPAGLTLGDTAPTITGAPAAEQAVATYTLAATDVDGDAATLPFTIAVAGNALPAFAAATGPAAAFTVSTAGSATLSTATGGDGTPTARSPAVTYTLTAADVDGDTATQTFTLTVADAVPTFGSRTISAKRYVVHTPVNDVLPAATGGDGTLTYTVAPGPPAGLSFTASPPTIAGTPTEAAVEATYTLTATDANGDRADMGFRLTVAGAPLVTAVDIESTPADADKAYRAGETIEVKVSFDSKLMHVFGNARAVIQAPFLSLRIGVQTRRAMVFTADPTSKTFRYPVQAADEDTDGISIPRSALSLNGGTKQDRTSGAAAILDLGVHAVTNDANHQVDGDRVGTAPTFASGLPAGLTYTEGRRVDPATSLPAATGGEGTLRYALTGPGAAATLSLPAGLTYGAPGGTTSGGTIGGTPTAGAAAATYTLTATDRDGDAGTHRFAVVVHADASPTFGPRTWTAQRYRKNVRVTTAAPGGTDLDYVALPAATGGDGALRYGLAPALPAGLTYTTPSGTTDGGRIAGTPTGIAAARDYTLSATDADGDQATLTFRLSVADPSAFRFTGTVAEQQYLTGVRVSLALPAAAGGDGSVTYALTPVGTDGRPDLPAGLSFAAATRTVAGTPTGTRAKTTYTFTATDAANNRAGPPGTGAGTGLPIAMEVRADTVPTFGSRASVSWPAAARVQTALSVNLPAASGGNGTLTYTLSPAAADGPELHRAGRGGRARRYDCRDADIGDRIHYLYVDRHR